MAQTTHNLSAELGSLALLANSTDPQGIGEVLNSSDLHQIYDLAIQHGMACQIHHNLVSLHPRQVTDETSAFVKKLSDYYHHYTVASHFVDHEAVLLLRKLAKQNMTVVVLKGFSLAYQVYEKLEAGSLSR